jgi:uncharacterized protein (TIRG00374 family)
MKRSHIWVSLVFGVALFFVVLGHISWREAWLVLRHARLDYLAMYLGMTLVIRLLLSWRWQVILHAKGIKIPFWKNVAYRTAGFAVSFVSPGPRVGGEFITAGLASKGKRYSETLSTLIIDRAVELQTFATMFFLGVFSLALLGDIPDALKVLLVAASSLLLALVILFVLNITHGKPFFTRILTRFHRSAHFRRGVQRFEQTLVTFYKEDSKEFFWSHVVGAVAWLLSIVEYKYLLLLLGFDMPLYAIFIVYSFVGLAYILPVPMAIGTLEGGQAAAFRLLGLSPAAGVVLALITRLRDLLISVIGFMILLYYGITPTTAKEPVR